MFDKTLFAISLFCSALLPVQGEEWLSLKAQRAQIALEDLSGIIEQALQDFAVPGLALGIVIDDQVILAKGYGFREMELKQPVTPNTVFAIGSCTKAFTTFAMAALMEEGKLYWDQAVVDILPEFRVWDQYATQSLTLRDLITHRSGLPRHDYMWYNSSVSREELFKRLRYLEPTCDIRERYNYNNLMYMTAGLAMERVASKSWEEIVSEKILKPLEMNSTNFSIADMQKMSDYAFPYFERNAQLKQVPFRSFSNVGPGASINSNVNDITHWIQMFLASGKYKDKALVSPAMIQEIEAPSVIISGYSENKEALLSAYGLGWRISSYRGHYYLNHSGGVDGFTTEIALLPKDNVGIVIFVNKNLSNLPYHLALEIIDRILEAPSYPWLKEGLEQTLKTRKAALESKQNEDLYRKKGTSPSHPLEEFEGDYEHPAYGSLTIELKEGKLQATLHGLSCILDHWHYDLFVVSKELEELLAPREGMKFTFRNNTQGEIEELLIPFESGAPDIIFKKKPDENLVNLAYYRQFCGLYRNEIYNVTVEVAIRNQGLIAIIPGLPIYELIPTSEDEFDVKSMNSYKVRFEKQQDGTVDEARVILPYADVSAKRVRNS